MVGPTPFARTRLCPLKLRCSVHCLSGVTRVALSRSRAYVVAGAAVELRVRKRSSIACSHRTHKRLA